MKKVSLELEQQQVRFRISMESEVDDPFSTIEKFNSQFQLGKEEKGSGCMGHLIGIRGNHVPDRQHLYSSGSIPGIIGRKQLQAPEGRREYPEYDRVICMEESNACVFEEFQRGDTDDGAFGTLGGVHSVFRMDGFETGRRSDMGVIIAAVIGFIGGLVVLLFGYFPDQTHKKMTWGVCFC